MSDEDKFRVVDSERGNERPCETRAEAEEKRENLISLGASPDQLEIVPPEEEDQPVPPQEEGPEATKFVENPIVELEKVNSDYVNVVKGTKAISKRGFRYLQSKFDISTTSEVVHVFENPKGVVVHARAELPDGRFAEAHGEGYAEGDVSGDEFVRYADTRAKNRALSDLTSSGALAEDELHGGK